MNILEKKGIQLWDYEDRKNIRYTKRYKDINDVWDNYNFNSRKNIGYCLELIKNCNPDSYESWEKFYLESGNIGNREQMRLKKKFDRGIINAEEYQTLNDYSRQSHGKTIRELVWLAGCFQRKLQENNINRTLEECFNYIYIKAIDESWLGYNRELNAVKALEKICEKNNCYIKEADAILDIKYCIDYELRQKNTDKLICGVQIKGYSYHVAEINPNKKSALVRAIETTKSRHEKYNKDFGARVAFLYMYEDGRYDRESYKNILCMFPNKKKSLDKQISHVKNNRYERENIGNIYKKAQCY